MKKGQGLNSVLNGLKGANDWVKSMNTLYIILSTTHDVGGKFGQRVGNDDVYVAMSGKGICMEVTKGTEAQASLTKRGKLLHQTTHSNVTRKRYQQVTSNNPPRDCYMSDKHASHVASIKMLM